MGSKKVSGSVKYQHNCFATNTNFEKVARDHLHSLFVNFRLDLLRNTSVSSNRDKNLNHSFFQVEKIWFALDQLWYDPGKLFKCDQPLPDELDSSESYKLNFPLQAASLPISIIIVGVGAAEFDGMYIITSLRAYLLMGDLIFDTYKCEGNMMCYPLGRDF